MINQNLLLTGDDGYNLTKSLRFRSSASAYLNRTPASATNRTTWTYSYWFKGINTTGSVDYWALSAFSDGNNYTAIRHRYPSDIDVLSFNGGSAVSNVKTAALFRDPAAWYHMVIVFDTSNATQADRIQIYQNGVRCPVQSSPTYPSAGSPTGWVNSTAIHYIGRQSTEYFEGYMAEIHLIDGQALTPSSFGQTSTSTGVWTPKKYLGTYGTNGFYLPFTNTTSTSTLGTDFSGNSNTWTVNNISLTSGSTYDSMTDVPTLTSATTANYCTLNAALQAGGYTLSDGNLNWARTGATGGTNDRSQFGTIGVTSGKWYWEFTAGTVNSNSIPGFGIAIGSASTQSWGGSQTGVYIYESDGLKYLSGTGSSYGATFTTGDIIGVAFDADAGTLTFYKNNTSQGQAASGLTSGPYFPAVTRTVGGGGSNGTEIANFGQRPFAYTPPTGFVALNTFNLPTPTIGATPATQANDYMDITLYTGNATTNNITSLGFQPDFSWFKIRSEAGSNIVHDVLRGTGGVNRLFPNTTSAESTNGDGFVTFTSNGFNLDGGGSGGDVNGMTGGVGRTYVAWNWKANGTGVSNTAGSITSTVSANTTAGFSIVTYTGNNTSGATVGHGLGVKPAFIVVKKRTGTDGWGIYHTSLGATKTMELNTTAGEATSAIPWNNTEPDNSVIYLNGNNYANSSSFTYVMYCFAPVAGYSAFGTYTGNNATDGPFIYTGFRPRFVMIKRTSSGTTGNWNITDTAINPYNNTTGALRPNTADSESTVGTVYVQPLSNGFKITNNNTDTNGSSTYIYAAFAESPFKYANAR